MFNPCFKILLIGYIIMRLLLSTQSIISQFDENVTPSLLRDFQVNLQSTWLHCDTFCF